MKSPFLPLLLAASLLGAAPAPAAPLPQGGITPQQMVEIMTRHGLPATLTRDSNGVQIITSRAVNVNFDVYFYECRDGSCRDIQFAAGWSNATGATPDRINEWNTTKRFIRVYWKPGNVVWAEQDARISRGTTENVEEYLALWPEMLGEFKSFMHL